MSKEKIIAGNQWSDGTMAAQDASATGADTQGDLRKRNVGQANGSYVPKELADRVDEKTKQKVDKLTTGYGVFD